MVRESTEVESVNRQFCVLVSRPQEAPAIEGDADA